MLALSANAYAEDLALSAEAGCDQHLCKPCTQTALLAAVARFKPVATAAHSPIAR